MGRLTKEQLKAIIGGIEINTLVETGTCEGGFSLVASEIFEKVITIELNDYYYNLAKENLKDKNIELIKGDSVKKLPAVINKLTSPVLFYLDAHYFNNNNAEKPLIPKSEFPLFKELALLKKRKQKDIIVVDDVHTFGRERPELRFNESPDWELVTTETILKAIGEVSKHEIIGDAFVIWK